MRNRKFVKPLLVFVAMVLVCIISVFATIAYLTDDTEVVKNTFTVGDIEIELDEAKVNAYGQKLNASDEVAGTGDTLAARQTTNSYKLVPKHEYTKDPTIHVIEESEDCYVRAFITVTKAKALEELGCTGDIDASTENKNFIEIFGLDIDTTLWTVSACEYTEDNAETTEEDESKYVFEVRYNTVVKYNATANQDLVIFSEFTTPEAYTNDDLADLEGMEISVKAQAIQADTFADANAAFTALTNAANA